MGNDIIEDIILNARLEKVCSPKSGDCEIVALSLNEVFDVEKYVCIYEPGENKYSTHATCKINGVLYDGKGETSREALKDYLDGYLTPEELGIKWNSKEEKIKKINERLEQLIVEHDKQNNPFREEPKKEIVDRLEKSKREVSEN